MRTITVAETRPSAGAPNGAVSFFDGVVEFDAREIRDFRIQLKATDEGADDVRIEDGILTILEAACGDPRNTRSPPTLPSASG